MRQSVIEHLETRQMKSVSLSINAQGTLDVWGSGEHQKIDVRLNNLRNFLQITDRADAIETNVSFPLGTVRAISVHGAGGNDSISVQHDINVPVKLYGDSGNDTLRGTDGNDDLYGGNGDDDLEGYAGADHLRGEAGNDLLGDSSFGGKRTDWFIGGSGFDVVDYSTHGSAPGYLGVVVYMDGSPSSGFYGEKDRVNADVEGVLGTGGNDTITGNASANFIDGNDGNDQISGGGGNDTLYGGMGRDIIYGGAGKDLIAGGWGNDTLYGNETGGAKEKDVVWGDNVGVYANSLAFDEAYLNMKPMDEAHSVHWIHWS